MSCWTDRNKYKLSFICMIILSLVLLIVKVFIGYKENSLSLVADSFHLILDLPALVIGFLALSFAKEEVSGKDEFTFGRVRAEILGAIVNTIFLIAICFSLAIESIKRLFVPSQIENPQPVLIIGIVGLIVNVIGLVLFRFSTCQKERKKSRTSEHVKLNFQVGGEGDTGVCQSAETDQSNHRSKVVTPPDRLNIHGVFLHILQHAFTASIVITSALIVMYAKGKWTLYVDPCLSLILVLVILKSLFPLMNECLATLMQSVPADLQLQNMEERLMKYVPEVVDVHELHIWQLAGDEVVGSAHIFFRSHRMYNQNVINAIQQFFMKEGISSLTIQPEFLEFASIVDQSLVKRDSKEDCCMLKCTENKCAYLRCCETPDKIIAKLQHQH